jgi:hypothetical protein
LEVDSKFESLSSEDRPKSDSVKKPQSTKLKVLLQMVTVYFSLLIGDMKEIGKTTNVVGMGNAPIMTANCMRVSGRQINAMVEAFGLGLMDPNILGVESRREAWLWGHEIW